MSCSAAWAGADRTGCGVCYMLSGTHGLYSSQLFVTEKLLSEYTESWGKRLHH